MLLKTLELENIRSYKREVIEFREGVALFEGDIGSGKSTILYAIEFALFGLGDLKSTFLLRSGEKEGKVTLSLDVDGREICFSRSLERKKNGASQKQCQIITGGTKAEYSPEEMKAEVLRLLKFNENPSPTATSLIYRYAIFTPQEEMKEILRLREDMRLETLRRAFGIEEYRIARNNAAMVSREIRERETFIAGILAGLGALADEEAKLHEGIKKSIHELDEIKAKSDAIIIKISGIQKKIDGLRQIKAVFDNISGEIPALRKMLLDKQAFLAKSEKRASELDAEILEKKKSIARLDAEKNISLGSKLLGELSKKPAEKTAGEIESGLRKMRDEISRLSSETGGLKNSIKDAEAAVRDADEKKHALDRTEAEIKTLGELILPSGKSDSEILAEISGIRARKDRLLQASGAMLENSKTLKKLISEKSCPTCGQRIDPSEFLKKFEDSGESVRLMESELKDLMQKEKLAEKEREELAAYVLKREKLSGLIRQKELLQSAQDAALKKCASVDVMRASCMKLEAELGEMRAKEKDASKIQAAFSAYVLAQAQIGAMRAEIESMHARLKFEESGSKSALSEISGISREIDEKERELEKLKASVSELCGLESEMVRLKTGQDSISKSAGEAEAKKNALAEALKKVESEIARKESLKKEKDSICETRMWLDDYFSNALVSIERHVLASINEEFNALFARLFGILMDENGLNVTINEFFTPAIMQNGYEQEINALSGGERTSVALAYRLALNSMVKNVCGGMSGSSLLILDEPTDGFSKEQLMRLRDVLAELACKQVVIVSHERELESFADHIYRVRKAGSVSVVEKG